MSDEQPQNEQTEPNGMNVNFDPPVPGAGVDAPMERRPGVPMEAEPPHPMGNASWTLDRQVPPTDVTILKRKELPELTPVFGNTIAPRLVSGAMRRAAYKIPEHFTSHWLLLMLSDRVDVLEHRLQRALPIVLPLLALGGVAALAFSVKRHRRRGILRLLPR